MIYDNATVSVILPTYNQQDIIYHVVRGILDNMSDKAEEFIIIFDGCTDKTEENANKAIFEKYTKTAIKILYADNVNEVKANNIGLQHSKCDYSLLVQDDIILKEKNFDRKMLKPFDYEEKLFAVGGRTSQDIRIVNEKVEFYNTFGRDVDSPKNIFAIRDIINRSPFLVNNEIMRKLHYFDEEFAPISQDDTDLCLRAYREGWLVGMYAVGYDWDLTWGTTRRNHASMVLKYQVEEVNLQKIIARHRDIIELPKHGRDIVIE